MKRFAILLGLVSCVGAARADCVPTDPTFFESDTIFVGEVVDYQRVPIPRDDYTCITTDADGYPDRNTLSNGWCDDIAAHDGYATIRVVDALKGNDPGEVGVLVTGIAVNGEWYTTDFSPGQRFIFGLGRKKPKYSRSADQGKFATDYRIFGFPRGAGILRGGEISCRNAVVEASEVNIAKLRATLNGVPFIHSPTDDSLRELPGDRPAEGGCWIKQRKGTEWRKVEIPCG